MKLTGAEIFVESLKREGVKHVFGLPGGVVLKIFDVLYGEKDLELILTRHEQGATHMAEGYARATGKVGVASGDLRSRRHQHDYRSRECLHGFLPDGDVYRSGFNESDWK